LRPASARSIARVIWNSTVVGYITIWNP
jgi:hypothetical protein